ncbi:MAG: hypothetical protein ACRDGS_04395, partial [Chloroflexota bacterium]
VTRLAAAILLGLGAGSVQAFGGTSSARPMIDPTIYSLHGTGPFSASVGSAVVTRLSRDRFRLSLTGEHLPPPTMLEERFPRHAYVAWLVDGALMHGPMRMGAVGLTLDRRIGTYRGEGSARMTAVTSVVVTAEPPAQAYMPFMPMLMVLASVRASRT